LNKYYIYSVISAFFFGLIVAGVGTSIFIRGHVDTNFKSMDRSYLTSWEQHSIDAYENEAPEVAVWVLQNFITLLQSRLQNAEPRERNGMQRTLLQSYARLALIYKETGNIPQYEENLTLALKTARQVSPETITNETELFQMLSHADDK